MCVIKYTFSSQYTDAGREKEKIKTIANVALHGNFPHTISGMRAIDS